MEKGWKHLRRRNDGTGSCFNPHRDGEGLEAYWLYDWGFWITVSIRIVMEKGWKKEYKMFFNPEISFNPHRDGEGLEVKCQIVLLKKPSFQSAS